ncbi:MAG: 5'-nucleotidase C-terminal domain-containing protein [Acidobacteriia bacterium]|nr:5'-nucleotidase C-terminal domain-containing protein [Terriglobia bacterium]
MQRFNFLRVTISVFFAVLFCVAARAQAQDPVNMKVFYTGRLLGYFRMTNWQSPDDRECPTSQDEALYPLGEHSAQSISAQVFPALTSPLPSILVGTGDNFAPELAAREFCLPPRLAAYPQDLGKDLYVWNPSVNGGPGDWVPNAAVTAGSALDVLLRRGQGRIPEDNVANFFIAKGYSALVPGRHDFYFGPERLRQMARLLASSPIPAAVTAPRHTATVQMLGANLVIESSWTKNHDPLSDTERPPVFIPGYPVAADLVAAASAAGVTVEFSGVKDGGSVYPWFTGVKVKVKGTNAATFAAALQLALQGLNPRICKVPRANSKSDFDNPANNDEDPALFQTTACTVLNVDAVAGDALSFNLMFPWQNATHSATLLAGERYRLCFSHSGAGNPPFCVRFSTYLPLFQSSLGAQCPAANPGCLERNPMALCRGAAVCGHPQHDPEPYALIAGNPPVPDSNDVVVFGVVDPHLSDTVGLLNLAWRNDSSDYKTQVAFKDPAEALQQLSAYFDRRYSEEHGQAFKGVRVLLAQMSPQQAQVLARRSSNVTVVVSAADSEIATLARAETNWSTPMGTSRRIDPPPPSPLDKSTPQFLAVPYPHYVAGKDGSSPSWVTDVGELQITRTGPVGATVWQTVSAHQRYDTEIGIDPLQQASWFTTILYPRSNALCVPRDVTPPSGVDDRQRRQDYLETITLCAIQGVTEADIAMLQKRDIFVDLPNYVDRLPLIHRSTQSILDRIVWKGDFLQLIYMPGSAIKKVMDQSKAFQAENDSPLTLADERNRQLITLGIDYDSDRKEYKVNGLALDPNKLYSIATSEFIAMGDTGYPDFAASQMSPPQTPAEAGESLETISSIVCQKIANRAQCGGELNSAEYFDSSSALPDDPRVGRTSGRQLQLWNVFHRRGHVPQGTAPKVSIQTAASQLIRNRPLWDFNLAKWTLGLTRVTHTGNNFDVTSLFGGLANSQPSTVSSTAWTSDLAATWSRNWRRNQLFVSPGYTFNFQHKGQADDLDQVTQAANLGFLDTGYAYTLNPRQPERHEFLMTTHFETPLMESVTSIKLKTTHKGEDGSDIKDQLRIHLDRSYTVAFRPGYRWKRRVSSVEFGPEWSYELKALTGINFLTDGHPVPLRCPSDVAQSLSTCASNALSNDATALNTRSVVFTDRRNQAHTGAYWKINMTVPFHKRLSYVLTDGGDYFWVRYGTENAATTLLKDYSQHQLKIDIFPSLSIGPEYDVLLYRNKAVPGRNGHFLFQSQLLIKAQWSFDWFNGRDWTKQWFYAPPATK